ncbi:putative membrane protein, partial [Clostridioides difficile CD196]
SLSYFKEMVYEFKKKNRKNMQFLIKRYILNIIIIIALSLGLQLILNTASIGIIKFLAK